MPQHHLAMRRVLIMLEIIGSYNFSQILQLLFTCMCIVVDVYFASVQIDSKLIVFQRLAIRDAETISVHSFG